jgi:hypothetical protein
VYKRQVLAVLVVGIVCFGFSESGRELVSYTRWWSAKAGHALVFNRSSIIWERNLPQVAERIAAREIGAAELVTVRRSYLYGRRNAKTWQDDHIFGNDLQALAFKGGIVVRGYWLAEILPGGFLVTKRYDAGKPFLNCLPEYTHKTSGENTYWWASCPVPSHP